MVGNTEQREEIGAEKKSQEGRSEGEEEECVSQ